MKPISRIGNHRIYQMNGLFVVLTNDGKDLGHFRSKVQAEASARRAEAQNAQLSACAARYDAGLRGAL